MLATVQVRLEWTDAGGTPLDSIHLGEDFLLKAYVQDIRPAPQGVFQAYLDLTYPAARATPNGPIQYGPDYALVTSGDTLTAGLINEVGGQDFDNVQPNPAGAELLLFTVPFHADALGPFDVLGDIADTRWIVLFDSAAQVPLGDVDFVGGSVEIVEPNDPPTITSTGSIVGLVEDQTSTLSYSDLDAVTDTSDPDFDPISFRVESVTGGTLTKDGLPAIPGVTLLAVGEEFEWTPPENGNGTIEAFTVKAFDGDLASVETVGINVFVSPVNDAPSFTGGPDIWNSAGGAGTFPSWATGLSAGPPDESTQALTFDATTDNDALFSVLPTIDAAGNLSYTFAGGARGTAKVSVTLSDNGGTANDGEDTSTVQEFYLAVDQQSHFWHNVDNPLDVSRDGIVSPHDLLLIFNELILNGVHPLPENPSPPDVPPPFWDVNDNGSVDLHDALLVINHLILNPPDLSPDSGAAAPAAANVAESETNLAYEVPGTDEAGSVAAFAAHPAHESDRRDETRALPATSGFKSFSGDAHFGERRWRHGAPANVQYVNLKAWSDHATERRFARGVAESFAHWDGDPGAREGCWFDPTSE